MTNEVLIEKLRDSTPAQRKVYMQMLYHNNLTIIRSIAKRYEEQAEIEDLIQEAYIILCEAVERYDLQSPYKFLTYYTNLLKWGFMEYCAKNSNDMYFTPHMIDMMRRYTKLIRERKDITDIGICYMLEINEEQLKTIRNALHIRRAKRYYEPIGGEDEELLLVDTIEDDKDYFERVEHAIEIQRLHEVLQNGIKNLESWQAEIIQKLYYEDKTAEEIAEEAHADVTEVRLERRKALRKLRRDRNINKYYKEQMHPDSTYYHLGLQRVSVAGFMRNHESSTERAVIKLMLGIF